VDHLTHWVVGAVLAAAVALVATRARALTARGAVAATVVGTIAIAAGWSWGVVLVAYFASSSLLSRVRSAERAVRVGTRIEKDGPRDATQVIANGGVFTLAAAGFWASPDPLWQALGAGALAASAADTWATEIGTLSSATPRSILDWSPVPAGTSGGVTARGLLGGAAGAAFVSLIAWLVRWPAVAIVAALVGGLAGCVFDSVIGAGFQARRWCASCGTATEQRAHACGAPTTITGGLRWLDNDGVNAISTIAGALFGAASARFY
jgi:uncharacterized protein (TIGR00297 family)